MPDDRSRSTQSGLPVPTWVVGVRVHSFDEHSAGKEAAAGAGPDCR